MNNQDEINDIRERLVRIETMLTSSLSAGERRMDEHADRLKFIENRRMPEVERQVWWGSGAAVAVVAVWEFIKFNFKR